VAETCIPAAVHSTTGLLLLEEGDRPLEGPPCKA
jgi:hypothetical protein